VLRRLILIPREQEGKKDVQPAMRSSTILTILLLFGTCTARAEQVATSGAVATYEGLSEPQAKALVETLAAARTVYISDFNFDMPQTVTLSVACGAGHPTRLFNDGNDRIELSIPSADSLAPPAKSGAFHLYGLCHELGHIAMYRTLRDRDWLTGAGAEGWAHFAGSVVVDKLYAAKGEKLWPDPYDYRADGTRRLEQQLKAASPSDIDRAAGAWRDLDAIVGHAGMVKLFAAWQKAQPDLAAPSKPLLAATVATFPEKQAALEAWWKSAQPLLVRARPKSGFAKVSVPRTKLEGTPQTLKGDDDAADGKSSIAGGGHARLFESPAEGEWYVTAVSIHGARYGAAAPPADQFDIALCDSDMHPIAVWKEPYKAFDRGNAKWVKFQVPQPTLLPQKFYVCAAFRPTARNGVYVDFDSSTKDHSRIATPGVTGSPLEQGDWMIRVEIDRAKGDDSLRRK
jgi:hypothetical protein